MLRLTARLRGGRLQLCSVPQEQLRRIHPGDSISVNGVPLKVQETSLEEGTITFSMLDGSLLEITLEGTSEVEFQQKRVFEDFP